MYSPARTSDTLTPQTCTAPLAVTNGPSGAHVGQTGYGQIPTPGIDFSL